MSLAFLKQGARITSLDEPGHSRALFVPLTGLPIWPPLKSHYVKRQTRPLTPPHSRPDHFILRVCGFFFFLRLFSSAPTTPLPSPSQQGLPSRLGPVEAYILSSCSRKLDF